MSVYAVLIRVLSASLLMVCPGLSLSCRINLPVPSSKPAGSGRPEPPKKTHIEVCGKHIHISKSQFTDTGAHDAKPVSGHFLQFTGLCIQPGCNSRIIFDGTWNKCRIISEATVQNYVVSLLIKTIGEDQIAAQIATKFKSANIHIT